VHIYIHTLHYDATTMLLYTMMLLYNYDSSNPAPDEMAYFSLALTVEARL
jgi:hypothetical protein